MRRQDIQLLAAARAGDIEARCEVGRRYLLGEGGFPRHTATGCEYLTHESMRDNACALRTLAENLPVHELIAADLLPTAERAGSAGSLVAQIKAAACHLMAPAGWARSLAWLEMAAQAGDPVARQARVAAQGHASDVTAAAAAFKALADADALDAVAVLLPTLRQARTDADLERLLWCLQLAAPWLNVQAAELTEFVVDALDLAEQRGRGFQALPVQQVERALEHRVGHADVRAAYQLGRALAGQPCGAIAADAVAAGGNLRKATALLLRAADGGVQDAWMHLYRLSSDHRSSVANPQMARFFLEKAAAGGNAEAQCRLGNALLRQSDERAHREQALHWLYCSGAAGDEAALSMMASMVLPVAGSDDEADAALEVVQRSDPWLAGRLAVARQFGLTRTEALAFNPVAGLRSWGLVVLPNPAAPTAAPVRPRAIPALSPRALGCLREVANLYARHDAMTTGNDGDVRGRSRAVRTLFDHHGIDESLFFARATPSTLTGLLRSPRRAENCGAPQPATGAGGAGGSALLQQA